MKREIDFERRDDARKIFKGVLDEQSLYSMYQIGKQLKIKHFSGFVKTGKESSVILAETNKGQKLAIKVYAIEAANFRNIKKYIIGDRRFTSIKNSKRDIVFAWCRKEFSNLQIAFLAGVKCPRPYSFKNNILVMDFIGDDNVAPRLMEVVPKDPKNVIELILVNMKKLYDAGIIHGDLSPYNILLHEEIPYFIDFSQGVLLDHNIADELLERDISNIVNYANKIGVSLNADDVRQRLKIKKQ